MNSLKRKGNYGIDAPFIPLSYALIGLVLLISSIVLIYRSHIWAFWLLVYSLFLLTCAFFFLHTSMKGKFEIWENIFSNLNIPENSKILDMGCGHGTVLIMAAKQLGKEGQAVGVDLWRKVDQSGNDRKATEKNAEIENVADKIVLHTADMMALPFQDNIYDYVFSNLAIHNIKNKQGREKAVREAFRVLKPGGTLVIVDIVRTKEYLNVLKDLSAANVSHTLAGWKGWWTGPWMPTHIIVAKKSK
ncbi:class I SAM-dependent methyltransferase [Bacillus smithii]|uniref:class I SAM-dependent methyltransferase n=1 Tax=Bacillus smithii TaxID=1479 RepID=UPI002E210ACA|nr:class I SAM-dependent methyltransferase [Bacillus smithii]MED4927041.1 class I SAM-dependent methyltransferase [Bacillus smithii]